MENLENTINGYHIINKNAITEKNWEEVFVQANENNNVIYTNGSHASGADCVINDISYSNKTARIRNNKISISSYRLTGCKNDIELIKEEIDVNRKNFDYYALLARNENLKKIIYNYYKIPGDFFKAKDFEWNKKYTKSNKFSGWKTNSINGIHLDITESMSSQLWIHTTTETLAPYFLHSVTVNKTKTINFSTIYKLLKNSKLLL